MNEYFVELVTNDDKREFVFSGYITADNTSAAQLDFVSRYARSNRVKASGLRVRLVMDIGAMTE